MFMYLVSLPDVTIAALPGLKAKKKAAISFEKAAFQVGALMTRP
jgi:hypothetical protein